MTPNFRKQPIFNCLQYEAILSVRVLQALEEMDLIVRVNNACKFTFIPCEINVQRMFGGGTNQLWSLNPGETREANWLVKNSGTVNPSFTLRIFLRPFGPTVPAFFASFDMHVTP